MEVVDTGSLAVQRVWAPVNGPTDTYRVGMLVGWQDVSESGVINAGAAGAGPDRTTTICGIIEAVDTYAPLHQNDTTAVGHYVAAVESVAGQAARQLSDSSDKGVYVKGDKSVHVKVALLTPWTKVKVPLFNGAFGTAPTVQTVTTAGTTGFIANECIMSAGDFTPIADQATLYCRTGNNKGVMRMISVASDTQPTSDTAMPNAASAVGDTYVQVPAKVFGQSALQTDAEALYFDTAGSASSGSFWDFNVIELNLQKAGEEHVIGFFSNLHFYNA